MLYVDYNWDLNPWGIRFDEELKIGGLGWKEGDYFRLVEHDGVILLKKVDKLEEFILKGAEASLERE